ncbi:hypothetical protein [Marinobacter sp.]|uniref:hypothetical protein n=1 Tax=Marinobacter sp. TaxID=50741 RepID=UPI003A8DEA8E
MAHLKHLTALALTSLLASMANGAPLIVDSFESGDMSATNGDGFDWHPNNRTSVVTAERVVYNNGEKDVAIPSGRDWDPKHGEHSLRFRYGAGDHMAEQRFNLGGDYEDIWFQYWVKVPINYSHGQSSPNNHKFFALWMDGYSYKGEGPTVAWEFWGASDGSSRLAFHYSEGSSTIMGGHQGRADFISVPDDRGRWMEITIHAKASSNGQSNDGVIELWRRWENESPSQRMLMHQKTDAVLPIPTQGPQGWHAGYFMGWANAAYAKDTEWLVDYITISTEPLLDSGNIAISNVAPNPPTLSIDN